MKSNIFILGDIVKSDGKKITVKCEEMRKNVIKNNFEPVNNFYEVEYNGADLLNRRVFIDGYKTKNDKIIGLDIKILK